MSVYDPEYWLLWAGLISLVVVVLACWWGSVQERKSRELQGDIWAKVDRIREKLKADEQARIDQAREKIDRSRS